MNANPTKTSAGASWAVRGSRAAGSCPAFARRGPGRSQALASRDPATAQAWAEEFGVPRAYASYQQVLDDPEVDAVYIPLPNELHQPWVTAAADAGKHVLCEKPLALDAREARAMVEHCRRRGVLLMEAFMWRHQPQDAGDPPAGRRGRDRRTAPDPLVVLVPDRARRLAARSGAGRRCALGCRLLWREHRPAVRRGASPRRSQAVAQFGPTGVDLSLTALLEFPGGMLATIDCSFEQPFRCRYELVGTAGSSRSPTPISRPPSSRPPCCGRTAPAPDSVAGPDRVQTWNSRRSTSTRRWSTPSADPWRRASSRTRPRTAWRQMIVLDRLIMPQGRHDAAGAPATLNETSARGRPPRRRWGCARFGDRDGHRARRSPRYRTGTAVRAVGACGGTAARRG